MDLEGRAKRVDQLLSQCLDLIPLLVGEQQNELVSRVARDEARLAENVAEMDGDVLQQTISRVVAHHIVDFLEVIQVQEHYGHLRPVEQFLMGDRAGAGVTKAESPEDYARSSGLWPSYSLRSNLFSE